MSDNDTSILLRLPVQLKADLARLAAGNGRKITSEINLRLAASLDQQDTNAGSRPAPRPAAVPSQGEVQLEAVSESDRTMLAIFRALPFEKQLALLSLLRS